VRTNAIRGTVAAVLLSATVLGLAGCVNAEKPAAPGAGNSVSYGPAPTASQTPTTAPSTTGSASGNPSANPSTSTSVATASQTAARHNAADVTFAKQAVLLRQQALTLANTGKSAGISSQLRALAGQITTDGAPAVSAPTAWLTDWGLAVPSPSTFHTTGVLSTTQLAHVTATQGIAFDMQWLQYMKANLAAARQAVATEVAHGTNPQAQQAARHWGPILKTEATKLAAIH
jgi:uncharacterized protein (DUF305 family)